MRAGHRLDGGDVRCSSTSFGGKNPEGSELSERRHTLFEYPPGKPIEAKLLTELLNLVVPSYEDERKKSATVRTVKKSSDYSRASS